MFLIFHPKFDDLEAKKRKLFFNFSGRYFLSVLGVLTNFPNKRNKRMRKKSLKKVSTSTTTVLHCDGGDKA